MRSLKVIVFLGLLAAALRVAALDLNLDQLEKDLGAAAVDITVIEPHEDCRPRECLVTYRGIPLRTLLEHYYPKQWAELDGEIRFFALDGYLGVVQADEARRKNAYLTFDRADKKPFQIDNARQNEPNIPLGPFYLVWDNRDDPELLERGAYEWPYQVHRIQLVCDPQYDHLIPPGASPSVRAGFGHFKRYCLNCHNLRGVGGLKAERDMRGLIAGKSRDDLQAWIDDPKSVNLDTNMPPLNPELGGRQRAQTIEEIVDYLEAL